VIDARWSARTFRTKKTDANLSAFVFHRQGGRPLSYSRFRTDVADACTAAGVSGRHIHDLRRSAARELRRAGVPESVCMAVTGHKTASMFRRYAITDSTDQARALEAREALLAAEASRADGGQRDLVNFSSTSAASRAATSSKPLV
jgi:integrase